MGLAEFFDSMRMALDAVRAHKLRSALTLLGVMIGVFSIILVMTTMRAMQRTIEGELASLGANTFQVQRWPAMSFGGPDSCAPTCKARVARSSKSRTSGRVIRFRRPYFSQESGPPKLIAGHR